MNVLYDGLCMTKLYKLHVKLNCIHTVVSLKIRTCNRVLCELYKQFLIPLHSEWPKLYGHSECNRSFGHSERNRVNKEGEREHFQSR